MAFDLSIKQVRFAILLFATLFAAGCGSSEVADTPEASALETTTISPTVTMDMPTFTPIPSVTPMPTDTLIPPTVTAEPTETTAPLPTSSPSPTALPELSGSGGGVIAYVSERDFVPGIHIMNADGSDQRRLTNGFDAHPDWSPDGRKIAFSTRPSGVVAISIYDLDRQLVQQLTHTERSPSSPDWSPDGSQLAIVYNPAHPGIDYELYLLSANGGKFLALTDSAGYQTFAGPDWSPDGRKIVFSADLEGNHDIYLMDSDGGNLIQLTSDEAHDKSPAWSPDGSQIAFETYRDGNWETYVMSADSSLGDGTGLRNITNSAARELWPTWSPDGSRIAFQSDRDRNWEIYVMNSDGSDPQRLTDNEIKDAEPVWRP